MVEIMDSIRSFFSQISIAFAELWFWPVVMIGLMLLAVIVMALLTKFSYENRILKSVNKLNKYFLSKPFITDENLVEFNLKMKKVPKVLRTNWQIYMLNREDAPTKYINVNTCIDKPLRTSSIEKNMSNFSVFTLLIAFLSFVIGLEYSIVLENYELADVLFTSLLVPFLIVLIYTISILAIRASKNDIYACLYENFPLYERNLTKAVTTLPSYVDYEILFTKQEIKEGIPILQQYLEKRALVEQQELEKARENSATTEEYDFSDLGIDGSLILERSMKESEIFIKIRKRLEDEITSIESEQENYRKNYEETVKDMQRKLQASRENLESLKTQMEASTNRIESNYIRKQQADEIKKQQQLEKDIEEATAKFNDEQISLQQEIDKRKKEIEEKREFVEHAMLLEFKHYANTLYKALTQKATEVGNQKLLTLAQENSDLRALITDIQGLEGEAEDVSENKNLIRSDDLTAENLYELTSADMEDLEGGRETSKQTEIDEDKKLEEKNAEAGGSKEEVTNSQEVENSSDSENSLVEENGKEELEANSDEKESSLEGGESQEESEKEESKEDEVSQESDSQNLPLEEESVKNENSTKEVPQDTQNQNGLGNVGDYNNYDPNAYAQNYNQGYYDPSAQSYNQGYYDPSAQNYNQGYYDPNMQNYNQGYYGDYNANNGAGGYYDNYNQNGYYDQNAYSNYGQNGYPNDSYMNNYAGGQMDAGYQNPNDYNQNANVQPTSSNSEENNVDSNQVSKEDLEAIQKQIEEENSRLQKEKQEFENRINDTLSKITAQVEDQKDDKKSQENEAEEEKVSKAEEKSSENDEEKDLVDKGEKGTTRKKVQKGDKEEKDEDDYAEIERLAKPRKERMTSRRNRGRKPQSRSRTKKNTSEIDELNQEMQKLLDSAKGKSDK